MLSHWSQFDVPCRVPCTGVQEAVTGVALPCIIGGSKKPAFKLTNIYLEIHSLAKLQIKARKNDA